jgi:hypothetical protein
VRDEREKREGMEKRGEIYSAATRCPSKFSLDFKMLGRPGTERVPICAKRRDLRGRGEKGKGSRQRREREKGERDCCCWRWPFGVKTVRIWRSGSVDREKRVLKVVGVKAEVLKDEG